MIEGGIYRQKRLSPIGIGTVVLLHGAAVVALLTMKMEMPELHRVPPLAVYPVPLPPTPPEHLKPPSKAPLEHPITTVRTIVERPADPPSYQDEFPPPPQPSDGGMGETIAPPQPPPPPPAQTFEPARARADLHSYVSNSDYPDAAIRSEEQGTTRFRLLVGSDGRVTDCIVTGSSGSSALDSATCRLMKSRARFTPARDASGKPTSDSVANAIRWVLPDG